MFEVLKSMMKAQLSPIAWLMASLLIPHAAQTADSQSIPPNEKTRIAIIGLDHDHVWELLRYIASEPQADLVAIADAHPDLVHEAKSQVPASVSFYPDYIKMLDEAKPKQSS